MSKQKFTITIHDTVTYWDIEAETEAEAVELALELWDERQPQCEVIEHKD